MLVVLAVLAIYVLSKNSRKRNLIIIPAGIVSLIAGLLLFRSTNLMSIVNGSAFQSNSWTNRIEHYSVLVESGFSELLLGHGIILDPVASVGFYFDSEYLSICYQYGVIGLLIWLGIILLLLFTTMKADRKSTFGWSLVIFMLGVALTNFNFLNVECATLMMTLVGVWLFLQGNQKLSDHSKEQSK